MNLEKFEQIKALIRKHPQHFDMDLFTQPTSCGTAACIAGWALTLEVQNRKRIPDPLVAMEVVDKSLYDFVRDVHPGASVSCAAASILGFDDLYQARRLFYVCEWPDDFWARYEQASTSKDYPAMAEIACERIDHFIATEGQE